MKKLLAILLMTALLLSASCIPAFAEGAASDTLEPTTGPWDGFYWMTGGAMIAFGGVEGQSERLVYYRQGMTASSPIVIDNEAVPGATYDKSANTLTLSNVKLPETLSIYYMGDDFKLHVEGTCELGYIRALNYGGKYSTSLNVIGTGTLTVNKEKKNDEAMYFYGDGESLMHLDIAPSVTVHLYANENASEEIPQNVMRIWSTYADPAVTAGGKVIPEAKSERKVKNISETIAAAWVEDPDRVFQRGKRVTSKTDPDGVYAVEEVQYRTEVGFEKRYSVTKYNTYPEFEISVPDPAYVDEYGDHGVILTEEEFEAGYDYVMEPQPKKIRYTSENREKNRGYRGVKFIKDGDPDNVYIGQKNGWYTAYTSKLDEISEYYLYEAHWDEDEQLYVIEGSAVERNKTAEELEAKGYTIVTEPYERHAKIECWENPAPFDDSNSQDSYSLITRSSDPDGLYVYMGKTYSGGSANKVLISPVHYDEQNDEYYLNGNEEIIEIAIRDWESDSCDFSYKIDKGEQRVEVQYIDQNYTYEDYSSEEIALTKDGEPGKYYITYFVEDTDGAEQYFVPTYPLQWHEDTGHYYMFSVGLLFGDVYEGGEGLEEDGYHMILEDQPVDYTVTGEVKVSTGMALYQDDAGNSYIVDYDDTVYRISDDNRFTYGDKVVYIGTPAEDVSWNDLHEIAHEEPADDYMWWIAGTEYHHIGTGEEAGILGDVDSDGNVEIRDATWIQRYVSVIEIPFTITKTTADMDGDDEITVMDATAIQYYLAQMKDPYHIGEPA